MQVTEENLTDFKLNKKEITDLIRLLKLEIKNHEHDPVTQTYYGMILGKLLIMKFEGD